MRVLKADNEACPGTNPHLLCIVYVCGSDKREGAMIERLPYWSQCTEMTPFSAFNRRRRKLRETLWTRRQTVCVQLLFLVISSLLLCSCSHHKVQNSVSALLSLTTGNETRLNVLHHNQRLYEKCTKLLWSHSTVCGLRLWTLELVFCYYSVGFLESEMTIFV